MHLSRRQVLVGGASAALLAACGSSGDKGATAAGADARNLVNAFDLAQPAGKPVRLPLVITEADGSYASRLPAKLAVRLTRPDGSDVTSLDVSRRTKELPRGYFPLETTFDVEGRWEAATTLDGRTVTIEIDVKDPSKLPAVPGPGDPLPKIPTSHDCTRDPACPFHATPLDQLIGGAKPIVLLVSTPAFCKVAICGPVLDLLVDRRDRLGDVAVVHAEVYTDDTAQTTAPIIDALGMTYEPALFIARADGTVVDRLDYIYDGDELDAAIAELKS
jgi:hypothetical protein